MQAPPDGWKQNTYYLVRISWEECNPVYRAIFYSGFLTNGQPGAYSCILHPFNTTLLTDHALKRMAYFEVIRELVSEVDMREERMLLLPREAREPAPDIEWII